MTKPKPKNLRMLAMSPEVRVWIKAALKEAAANPIPLAFVKANAMPDKVHVKLADRNPNSPTRPKKSQNVLIPFGYRAAISFEEQPIGLCKHLSISVDRKGFMPSKEAVEAIAAEFGIRWPDDVGVTVWIEEFERGHNAINLLAPIMPKEGHA